MALQPADEALGWVRRHGAGRSGACQHAGMQERSDVVVVGAGIAGLTAAALLAKAGLQVQLLEAHHQSGGCAGTFRRGAYTFDVGATQVAGLEPGGIHARIFQHLGVDAPLASPLDPGCVVDLGDGSPPVQLWRDPSVGRRNGAPSSPAVNASGSCVQPCTGPTGPSLPEIRCCPPAIPGIWPS